MVVVVVEIASRQPRVDYRRLEFNFVRSGRVVAREEGGERKGRNAAWTMTRTRTWTRTRGRKAAITAMIAGECECECASRQWDSGGMTMTMDG